MPLRDHFRPPVPKRSLWEGFHGGWPIDLEASYEDTCRTLRIP